MNKSKSKGNVIKIISKEVNMNSIFFKGEIGLWNGQLYISKQDINIWNPQTNPNFWEKYDDYLFVI